MGRDVGRSGAWLAGAGITAVIGYLIATVAAGGRHPNWPYLLFGALAVAGAGLYAAGQKEKQSLRAADGKMRLTITEPALVLNGTAHYSDLESWLSNPLKPGTRRSGLPLRGQVRPPPGRCQMRIRIFTDQWYDQGKFLIDENGNFSGLVYINTQRPQARFELTVENSDGINLLRRYANLI